VYSAVLERERAGGYLGGTVQVIPHVTQEIKNFIFAGATAGKPDVLITEIGGTVGDIESQPFLEAIRQVSLEHDCLFVHVTLIPYLRATGEHKSKPTQHSVKELRSIGIAPNIIITRADEPLSEGIKDKIALFCNVKPDCVIENITMDSLYETPIMLHENGLDEIVCRELGLDVPSPNLHDWKAMLTKMKAREKTVTIAIVGKYVKLHDAYISIIESLNHAGFEAGAKVEIKWVDSEEEADFSDINGMIIPGGFGDRGIEGKISACKYARENNVPYLGICLGMQIAVIEYARHVCGLQGANSAEFVKFDDLGESGNVIDIMPDQIGQIGSGGTMRLGAYPCNIAENTLLGKLYGAETISERHRHRFEFNNDYRQLLTEKGLKICGVSPDGKLVEAIELPDKGFFIGVQFHPEFKSRPNKPHPLFLGLVKAAMEAKFQ
jgi:CTP synthase